MKIRSFLTWSAGIAMAAVAIGTNQNYKTWKQQMAERFQTKSHLLETALGSIEYQMEGDGPVVMIIHGSPGGYDQGATLGHFLDLAEFTTLALSRPGYRRTPLTSGVTPEAQADLFAAMLDTLNIPQVVIVAVSGGGPSALQFVLRHPDRCQGLILLSALTQNYTEEGVYRSLPVRERLFKRFFDNLIDLDPFLYFTLALLSTSPKAANLNAFVPSLVMNNRHTAGYKNDMQQFADLPAYPLQEIVLPTLIIHGTADIDIPFPQAEQLSKKLPNSELVAVEDADHLANITNKKGSAAIRIFCQKCFAQLL